jgi:hypothetical protein
MAGDPAILLPKVKTKIPGGLQGARDARSLCVTDESRVAQYSQGKRRQKRARLFHGVGDDTCGSGVIKQVTIPF